VAGLPPELPKRWEREISTALQSDQVKAAFAKIGVRPGTLGAEGYTNLIKSELARWKDVIREANIKAD
jgi:tripartite-type tricarboxylate transporter receptor subunit TctC